MTWLPYLKDYMIQLELDVSSCLSRPCTLHVSCYMYGTTAPISLIGLAPPILHAPVDEPSTKPLNVRQITTFLLFTVQL